MRLLISNEQDIELSGQTMALIRDVLEKAWAMEENEQDSEVSLVLVDLPRITDLNREYRGIDAPTDVLSFPLLESGGDEPEFPELENETGEKAPLLLGDIVIAVARAKEQAASSETPLEHELAWLALHGLLHLLGYDHGTATESGRMREKEATVLGRFGIERPWREAEPSG